jgi:hypothetical protein
LFMKAYKQFYYQGGGQQVPLKRNCGSRNNWD